MIHLYSSSYSHTKHSCFELNHGESVKAGSFWTSPVCHYSSSQFFHFLFVIASESNFHADQSKFILKETYSAHAKDHHSFILGFLLEQVYML